MWIQLTDCDGKPVTFNSQQMVALMEHGDRTLIIYKGGQIAVSESQSEILAALRLQEPERRSSAHLVGRPPRLV